jgi:hypothetical protein
MGSDYVPIMPVALSENRPAKLGAAMGVYIMRKEAAHPELAREFLSFVSSHPETAQNGLDFMLTADARYQRNVSSPVASFYLEHTEDLSFSSFVLFHGQEEKNEIAGLLRATNYSKLNENGITKDESIKKIIDRLNWFSY